MSEAQWTPENETEWVDTPFGVVGVHQPMFPGDTPKDREKEGTMSEHTTPDHFVIWGFCSKACAECVRTGADRIGLTEITRQENRYRCSFCKGRATHVGAGQDGDFYCPDHKFKAPGDVVHV